MKFKSSVLILTNQHSYHAVKLHRECALILRHSVLAPAADDIPKSSNSCSLQWVTKWVDYSNKYGFGYQLSDHTVGVLFNNGTHMSLLPDRKYAPASAFTTFTLNLISHCM